MGELEQARYDALASRREKKLSAAAGVPMAGSPMELMEMPPGQAISNGVHGGKRIVVIDDLPDKC